MNRVKLDETFVILLGVVAGLICAFVIFPLLTLILNTIFTDLEVSNIGQFFKVVSAILIILAVHRKLVVFCQRKKWGVDTIERSSKRHVNAA